MQVGDVAIYIDDFYDKFTQALENKVRTITEIDSHANCFFEDGGMGEIDEVFSIPQVIEILYEYREIIDKRIQRLKEIEDGTS